MYRIEIPAINNITAALKKIMHAVPRSGSLQTIATISSTVPSAGNSVRVRLFTPSPRGARLNSRNHAR